MQCISCGVDTTYDAAHPLPPFTSSILGTGHHQLTVRILFDPSSNVVRAVRASNATIPVTCKARVCCHKAHVNLHAPEAVAQGIAALDKRLQVLAAGFAHLHTLLAARYSCCNGASAGTFASGCMDLICRQDSATFGDLPGQHDQAHSSEHQVHSSEQGTAGHLRSTLLPTSLYENSSRVSAENPAKLGICMCRQRTMS
jgi:hypothetical protein